MKSHDFSCQAMVLSLQGKRARVSLPINTSCGMCALQSACNAGKSESRIVEIETVPGVLEGQTLTITLSSHKELQAIALLFFLPVLLMVLLVWLGLQVGMNRVDSALLALLGFTIYFAVMRVLDPILRKKFEYKIVSNLEADSE